MNERTSAPPPSETPRPELPRPRRWSLPVLVTDSVPTLRFETSPLISMLAPTTNDAAPVVIPAGPGAPQAMAPSAPAVLRDEFEEEIAWSE